MHKRALFQFVPSLYLSRQYGVQDPVSGISLLPRDPCINRTKSHHLRVVVSSHGREEALSIPFFQNSGQLATMHCLRQLIFLDIILVIFVFADKLDTSEKPQTEATQIGISTTHASQTDNSPDTTGRGCTDNSPDSTCFVGSGSYASTLPASQTLNAPIATGRGCTDNSPDSTCFVGSGSYASTLPASQTLNAPIATGRGCTDNSPDSTCFVGSGSYASTLPASQTLNPPIATGKGCTGNSPDSTCFVGSGSYASTPHVTATNNSPDTNIGRPTAMETHTSVTPCGNICGPVRAAEIVCGRMHPNSNVRYLDCVCASNNATTPIGACSRCKIAQGDLHDCEILPLTIWKERIFPDQGYRSVRSPSQLL